MHGKLGHTSQGLGIKDITFFGITIFRGNGVCVCVCVWEGGVGGN